MAHMKRFAGIPMSKSMRGICKEEDYVFLNNMREQDQNSEENRFSEADGREKREERARRRLEREQQEQDRLRELEEERKEKEQQWRSHVAELANERDEAMRERANRLREFRNFQKKVLVEDLGLEPGFANEKIEHLLIRM